MPREHRKRGQRKKKREEGEEPKEIQDTPDARTDVQLTTQAQPLWIEDAPEAPVAPENNFEAPWGYVDPDVKAYFRTVEEQMLEWQSTGKLQGDEAPMDKDPNEGRMHLVLFRRSCISTPLLRTPTVFCRGSAGNARQRVTTGNRSGLFCYTRTHGILYGRSCSTTVHRELFGIVGFTSATGEVILNDLRCRLRQLITHRFASHVVQTFLVATADTITRETQGIFPATQVSAQFQNLRSLTDLVLVICEVNISWSGRTNLTSGHRN